MRPRVTTGATVIRCVVRLMRITDGDELSDTVVDIWKLIHMIDRLEQENDHLRKQVEIMRKERG